jgi:hypothetical protein
MRIEIEKKEDIHALFLVGERIKKNHRRQFDHYILSHTTQ